MFTWDKKKGSKSTPKFPFKKLKKEVQIKPKFIYEGNNIGKSGKSVTTMSKIKNCGFF